MKKKNKPVLRYYIFFSFLSLCFLIFVDFFIKQTLNWLNEYNKIETLHPIFHHSYKKNGYSSKKHPLGNFDIFTNSIGFRDKEIRDIENEVFNKRILFIGDAQTKGVFLNYPETFVGIIEKKLSKKNIQVLNAARASYSPIIYWKKIEHYIEKKGLDFDELFVFLDISDPQDESVFYKLSNGKVVNRKDEGLSVYKVKLFVGENFFFFFKISNIIYDLFSDQIKRDEFIQKTHEKNVKEKDMREKRIEEYKNSWINIISENQNIDMRFVRSMWTIDSTIYSEYGEQGISLMKVYMKNLKNLLDKKNIKLTICVYPWPTQVWHDDLESLQVKIWSQFAKNNQIGFMNFFPYFIQKGLSDTEKVEVLQKYFVYSYEHFNKKGHRLIAEKFLEKFEGSK